MIGDAALFAGRYRLDRRLGSGGMSTVRLAFDTRLERHVAVKLLAEHLATESGFVARFRREALAAARLVHPNVVQVFDFGSDEATGRQFIVMEWIDGPSCAELLRDRGHLEVREAVDILCQACSGLAYAHRNGVIHRDVKPGNLLVNPDHLVKLADFGIAKATEQSSITRVGSVVGTAAYLSPEQSRGEGASPQSDLYALGVVAYQLLCGRLPYDGSSLTELARLQETGPPERPDRVNREVPPTVADAVLVALRPNPEERYADASAMESALRDALRGIAPAEAAPRAFADTDATRMLEPDTDATRPLPPQRRGALEPVEEAPRRARAAAPPPTAPRRRRTGRVIASLVALLAVAAIAFGVYQGTSGGRPPIKRDPVDTSANASESLDRLQQLIQDNTR